MIRSCCGRRPPRWGSTQARAAPAADAELVELGAQVRFRHPLVRSAVYGAAAPEDRRRVHQALAEATDADVDPDRRAWHRAQATAGLDEEVAAELERSAGRARARGGLAAGAAFHERAAELTPDPARRARRALAAAQSKHQAGASEAAQRLLAMAQAGPLDELERARAQLLHAQITFAATRGRDAPPLLLEAAKRLEPLDATLARETYLDAFAAAFSADRLVGGGDAREVAAAVLAADWGPSSARACDLLLDGLALAHDPGLRRRGAGAEGGAARRSGRNALAEEDELRWLWLACHIARALGDDVAWDELTARQVELARRTGALSLLPVALDEQVHADLFCGRLAAAMSLAAEADAVVEATGSHLNLRGPIALAIWRGQEAEAMALIKASRQEVLRRGEGIWLASVDWGSAVLYNGLGRYDDALAAAERAAEDPHGLGTPMWVLVDLVEAAVRSGKPERAAGPLAQLTEIAEANGTDWALGFSARSRAMCSEGQAAESLYREAIERLGRTRIRVALARALLVYGEWLRRENRRVDAREQLRAAHDDAHRDRHGGLRRARPPRAARHRRDGAQAQRRDARRADAAGGADRAPGGRQADEPGDRRPAVPQPPHGRVAPAQGVREARDQLPQGAPLGAVRRRRCRPARLGDTAPRRARGRDQGERRTRLGSIQEDIGAIPSALSPKDRLPC